MIPQPTCPACASEHRFGPVNINRWEGDWPGYRCRQCGHRYHDPMPDAEDLKRMYTAEYFDPGGHCRPVTPGGYFDNEERIRNEAKALLARLEGRTGRLLEVGCAAGFYLDEARKAGFEVEGLELADDMAAHARDKLKLKVQNLSVVEAEFEPHSFDVIASNRVMEHIPSIVEVLAKIHSWLRPGGVFLVSGPFEQNTRDTFWYHLNKLRRGGPKLDAEPPYHVHGFSRKGWYTLMERAGFRPISLQVGADTVHLRVRSLSDLLMFPIELVCLISDRMRGRGSFMVAVSEAIEE